MEKYFKYSNEVISCINDIVSEKFSDEFELVFDSTEPWKTGFKSKFVDFEYEVTIYLHCFEDKEWVDFCFNDNILEFDFDTLTEKTLTEVIDLFYSACKETKEILEVA